MALQVMLAFVCALGIGALLWLGVGCFLLPARKDSVTVWVLSGEEAELERELRLWRFLHRSGLLGGGLLLIETRPGSAEDVRLLAEQFSDADEISVYDTSTEERLWNENK